jgi:hypothetical protein
MFSLKFYNFNNSDFYFLDILHDFRAQLQGVSLTFGLSFLGEMLIKGWGLKWRIMSFFLTTYMTCSSYDDDDCTFIIVTKMSMLKMNAF